MGGYYLKIGSLEFSISAESDESAEVEAQKIIDMREKPHENSALYYIRLVTKYPAVRPLKREMPELKDFNPFK